MTNFPAPPSRTWRKGAGVPVLYHLRHLAPGQSVLLVRSDSRKASAQISRYRAANPADPGAWTSRTVAGGVEILRLESADETDDMFA